MSELSDDFFLLMKIKRDVIPADIPNIILSGILLGGGNLASPTHVAEKVDGSLSHCRATINIIRQCARSHGVDVQFAKILRQEHLMFWAEKNGAKVCLPSP